MIKKASTAYLAQTAGRLMTDKDNIPIVSEKAVVVDVERLLRKKAKTFETINYIYVIDSRQRLRGTISIKEIFRSPKSTPVKELLPQKLISVRTHTDQERVALLALKHSLKAIPVVDKENRLLGVVPSDVILKVLYNEEIENLLRFGGIYSRGSFDDFLHLPVTKSIKHRLPWLFLGLLGGLLAAGIVSGFGAVLSQNLILAAFIPLIVYMADAVGTQMQAFIIRDLAFNPKLDFIKYFLKQLLVVSLIGIVISAFLFLISLILYGKPLVSTVLGTALFAAILSSVISGLTVPYLFGKLKFDPANASGPVATITQDILSVFLYFSISSLLL